MLRRGGIPPPNTRTHPIPVYARAGKAPSRGRDGVRSPGCGSARAGARTSPRAVLPPAVRWGRGAGGRGGGGGGSGSPPGAG